MQFTSNKILNKNYLQIYLTKEELEKEETKEFIKEYKEKKYNIAIFLSGKENYSKALKEIITKEVELNNLEI